MSALRMRLRDLLEDWVGRGQQYHVTVTQVYRSFVIMLRLQQRIRFHRRSAG